MRTARDAKERRKHYIFNTLTLPCQHIIESLLVWDQTAAVFCRNLLPGYDLKR